MRTAALICEFNPFHNGHAYILSKLREEYNADYVLAIMSGNYVQRGEPAVFDKYVRAKAALKGDGCKGYADAVIELPTLFSTASAGDFASAGVLTALKSGVVSILGFGTEDGVGIGEISRHAALRDTIGGIKGMLSSGYSYPQALAARLKALGGVDLSFAPNNILAVEYLRALNRYDKAHSIEAVAVPRVGDSYSSTAASDERYCSAAAIREKLFGRDKSSSVLYENEGSGSKEEDKASSAASFLKRDKYIAAEENIDNKVDEHADTFAGTDIHADRFLSTYMPEHAYMDGLTPVSSELYASLLSKTLLDAKYRGLELTKYADVSREIADRLIKIADMPMGYRERIEAVKTRQYTYTRISRALLHIALGITRAEVAKAKADGYCTYIRPLGFRQDAAPLLKRIKECASVPVISKTADHTELLHSEIYYSGLYYALSGGRSEYERSPVVL